MQDGICYEYCGQFDGFKINRIDGALVYPNKMPKIQAGVKLYRNYDSEFEKILSKTKTVRKIGVKFEVFEDKITAEDTDFNMVTTCFEKTE